MIPNAISSVTASHIKDLVADGISESRGLDYKKELPTGADGRIGFLKDVAAFANTSGGDLVFGVDEEVDLNGKRTGRAGAIPGLQNLDDVQKLRLEQWVRTGIEPRVYVQLYEVNELTNGPVLVVRVPRSLTGPHMVKGRSQFLARGNTGNYEMDVDQLRRAFLESHSLVERVANFHRERVASDPERSVHGPIDGRACFRSARRADHGVIRRTYRSSTGEGSGFAARRRRQPAF